MSESTRPAWTLTEAAERTGVSRSSMRRYREAGRFPNAFKDSTGAWRFPLEDLLAIGLRPVDPAHAEQVSMPTEQGQPGRLAELELEVVELRSRLAVERERSAGLERLAQAAEANARDLRMALRMLEGGRAERPAERGPELPQSMPVEQAMSGPLSRAEQPTAGQAVSVAERPGEGRSLGWLGKLRDRLR